MKTALITGASRGIGRAIAALLAENNYQVIANYNHSDEAAKQLQKEFAEKNINIDIFKADVSKREEVKQLINFVLKKYGKIDILVNNAGIDQKKLFQDITDEEWNNVFDINLYSVFCTTQEAVQSMIQVKNGCIINISSIWGQTGASCEVAYSTTKAAINGMTRALAKELGPSNIRVNAIAPGIIDTQMNDYLTKEEKKLIQEELPLNRIGKPIDIAKCVKWLIEDEYTTGQIISINGGWYI